MMLITIKCRKGNSLGTLKVRRGDHATINRLVAALTSKYGYKPTLEMKSLK